MFDGVGISRTLAEAELEKSIWVWKSVTGQ